MKVVQSAIVVSVLTIAVSVLAQPGNPASLPSAPPVHAILGASQTHMGTLPGAHTRQHGGPTLTRRQAEQMAIRNNPRVLASHLLALAQHQVLREARSADLPYADASLAAVDAENGSRISAGGLPASRLINHAGSGVEVSQLITNFGRVHNLVLTRMLQQQAMQANALATSEEIVLFTDQAFYNALTAQADLQVARETVAYRSITERQVNELTNNKLRSTLDLSIAQVDLSQAKLMEIDAENRAASTMATLDAVLGLDHNQWFHLISSSSAPPAPPVDYKALVQQALQQRPDLQALHYQSQSAKKYARSEWDQLLPSISALGTAGVTPVRTDQYYNSNWWGGVGVDVNIPVFNGFLYNAQAKEARYRAQADANYERNLRDNIVSQVRIAWLETQAAYRKLSVTQQLLKQANLSLTLAKERYKLGLSSIVELSDSELEQTSAQIQYTNARYEYRLGMAVLRYQLGK